jgi:hypothetical protein
MLIGGAGRSVDWRHAGANRYWCRLVERRPRGSLVLRVAVRHFLLLRGFPGTGGVGVTRHAAPRPRHFEQKLTVTGRGRALRHPDAFFGSVAEVFEQHGKGHYDIRF